MSNRIKRAAFVDRRRDSASDQIIEIECIELEDVAQAFDDHLRVGTIEAGRIKIAGSTG